MATILDKLVENNEFPVVFIGAGISKRFLVNFPDWTSLLEGFWVGLGLTNFYGEFNNIRVEISKSQPEYTDKEIDYYSNIKMGTLIEEKFNWAFNNGEVVIKEFTPKDAFRSKISPFKKAISNQFLTYKIKEEKLQEFEVFKRMLLKTQIILTTNYDTFIEDAYNSESDYEITKYIGQKGFFQGTYGYAELYKLHGSVESPNDIIIAENDYAKFDNNSVLISAKIISMMMNSPIIFMGYSLTDINVRKIIKEFTRSLTEEEILILEDRLVLIEYQEGESEFNEEVINDKDLGCKLKVIKTDNYEKVFNIISTINQGIAPTEVRKYQHVIKQLIIDRGKKGTLNSVLLSPEELDNLEEHLQTKNITVALGDAKYIFQIPDLITYSLDYISDIDEISNEIRMRFAVNQNAKSRFPIHKILDRELINSSNLHPTEKEKLIQKIDSFSNFIKHYNKIVSSSVFNRDSSNVEEITSTAAKKVNVYETLSFNIQRLNLEDLKVFLVNELEELKQKGEITMGTQLRRLLLLYDIRKNKRGNA
ncbi:SIR2 family protein [Gottfriedia sp. OAE603]|uniref:SIR2 family protein n=1 Tax=Gottfriedia sp. OAE603 TaxID=2663872 RepID=UPI00178BF85F